MVRNLLFIIVAIIMPINLFGQNVNNNIIIPLQCNYVDPTKASNPIKRAPKENVESSCVYNTTNTLVLDGSLTPCQLEIIGLPQNNFVFSANLCINERYVQTPCLYSGNYIIKIYTEDAVFTGLLNIPWNRKTSALDIYSPIINF